MHSRGLLMGWLLAWLGPLTVGIVFLVTGGAKALAPSRTLRHLYSLDLIPARWLQRVWIMMSVGEMSLGAALVSGLAPTRVLPAAVGLLAGLSGFTIWSAKARHTDDCGCYGGLVEVQPKQSVVLNAAYGALLLLAWRGGLHSRQHATWRMGGFLGAVALSAAATAIGDRRLRNRKGDLLDLRAIKPGRKWNRRWLPSDPSVLEAGEHIVALLGLACPTCHKWLRPLSVIHERRDLPPVVGMIDATESQAREFAAKNHLAFPLVAVPHSTLLRLADGGTPTLVVVQDGVVRSVDAGRLPSELMERVRRQPARATQLLGAGIAADLLRATATAS